MRQKVPFGISSRLPSSWDVNKCATSGPQGALTVHCVMPSDRSEQKSAGAKM